MRYADAAERLADCRWQIAALREKMRETQAVAEPGSAGRAGLTRWSR